MLERFISFSILWSSIIAKVYFNTNCTAVYGHRQVTTVICHNEDRGKFPRVTGHSKCVTIHYTGRQRYCGA